MIKGFYNPRTYKHRVYINGKQLSIKKSQRYLFGSSTTFNWGYRGGGPSQLAFALLLEFTNERMAYQLQTTFEQEFIATLPNNCYWAITEKDLMLTIYKCAQSPRFPEFISLAERKRGKWRIPRMY